MARRRSMLAELQRQQRLAQARASAAQRANAQAQAQAVRAKAAAERARAAAARASETERKRLEKEAQAAYVEARQAEAEEMNEALAAEYEEIDGLLQATLDVDDWVDLDALKRSAEHPPFPRWDLEAPHPVPDRIIVPAPPELQQPEPVKGLFGRQKKQEEALQRAQQEHVRAWHEWDAYRQSVPALQAEIDARHAAAEQERANLLATERATYDAQCRVREQEASEHNAQIDALIAGLGYGAVDAVQEYVGIVLANSIYPESFPVDHDADFDPETAELKLRVTVPAPTAIRAVKTHRYVKASDEITAAPLAKRDESQRYAGALHQVALRSLHEIFEADRRGVIQAVSVEVGPWTQDPATGRTSFMPLVAVTSARSTFLEFDLSGVVPSATLQHLGASVSKDPLGLATIDPSGVRRL
jgi:restriction system protein